MTGDSSLLDFVEYRCALVVKNLWDSSEGMEKYGIHPATAQQKAEIFGMAAESLFTKGVNNARFELFHDPRTDGFILGFHSTKTLLDWIDNIQQFFGAEAELYQQAKEIAGRIRPGFRDKIISTGHSLGGGLATVIALASGSRAIVFNPPKIHRNTIAGLSQDDSRIARYRVKGDIASNIGWSRDHVELGRETSLTTIPFHPAHSIGQVLAGLENELSFSAFLMDGINEILRSRVAVKPAQLRRFVFDIVQGKTLPSDALPDLFGVEYQVEKVGAEAAKITVSVVYRKDRTSAELIKQESDWKWDDLPEEFRSEFIRKRETLLVYSLYKKGA